MSQKLTIPIGGMHCQNCVNSVKKKLSALVGVEAVDVDLGRGQATVTGNGMDVAAMRQAIEDLGFDAGAVS